jgi:Beta/Gamma crystallin
VFSKLKALILTPLLVAAFTVTAPAGSAFAITTPDCTDPNFVEIWGHNDATLCFANQGEWDFIPNGSPACWWAYKISTGNNDIDFADTTYGQAWTHIPRYTVETFPTVGWVCVGALRID